MRIGVFDSGIGGLTVFAALDRAVPEHDLIYLGDTARVPYGTRSPRTVRRYALRVASYLHAQGADALVIACNTATAHALPTLRQAASLLNIPVRGVIEPGVQAALTAHRQGAIGIFATEGTIAGGTYQDALRRERPDLQIFPVACPLLVPLAEEGWTHGAVPRQVVEHYVGHLRETLDTAILGCTHYPLLRDTIAEVLPDVTLVDSAQATAEAIRRDLGPLVAGRGSRTYIVTDHVARFQTVGERFLGHRPEPVIAVDLPPAVSPFLELKGDSADEEMCS
ncbi:MAG: glutamate racemase [Deltaproteobacteria bacterium]|nr:MAG: glutamate racemase [Deltaproteobacteria bacterium]